MVDVDHFKRINDEFGHHGGDETLRAVAQALRGALRDQDIVARWGGEEFIALLPDTDGAGAVHVAETLRQAVAGLNVVHNTASIRVTASFGLAVHEDQSSLEATTSRADAALYRAKRGGRNCIAVG
jgi:diguanylate cyclase (GGDEF)-like protein